MSHERILLVEDDPGIREVIQELLESEGYVVESATNGEEGFAQLQSMKTPDLILLDLMMPVLDGFSFRALQAKEARLAKIPTIVMTAMGITPEEKDRLSCKGFLRKPVDIEEIIEVVKEGLA